MNEIEELFLLFIKGTFLWIFLCILGFYIKAKFFQKLKESKKKQVQQTHEIRKNTTLQPKQTCTDPSYERARDVFNCAMKNGQLGRTDIIDIKKLIDVMLGNNQKKYEKYYFKNDAHEIYVKLKDGNLNVLDYQQIVDALINKATSN